MLSESIKHLRKTNSETQQEMADRLGVSQKTVASWERGTRMPSYDVLAHIADMYHVSTDFLLGRDTPTQTEKTSNQGDSKHSIETKAAHATEEMTPEVEARVREIFREMARKHGGNLNGSETDKP